MYMTFQETEKIELKRVLNETLPKEIVAFLNSYDGVIYIGVDDNGKIIGVNNLDDIQKRIADIITTQILPNPQSLIELGSKYIDGKNVVEIKVKRGSSLFYIKKYGRSANGCFVRIGTTCRSMTEEEIEQRFVSSISVPDRSIKDIPILRDDLTFAKLKQYLVSKGIHFNDSTFYKNFGLVTDEGKFNLLADILADNNMNSIKVAVFKGKDKSRFVKRNEYGYTCLIESIEKVLNYCDALNETFIDVSVRPRREYRLFSGEAFKEAWINACVHNRWSEELAPSVYWFDDRLEIVSYGGIPKNLTKEEFLSGKTEPVNKELMKIFLQCGIVEHSGHGVPIVVREYGEEAYSFSQNMITVTIPFNKQVLVKNESIDNLDIEDFKEQSSVKAINGVENAICGVETVTKNVKNDVDREKEDAYGVDRTENVIISGVDNDGNDVENVIINKSIKQQSDELTSNVIINDIINDSKIDSSKGFVSINDMINDFRIGKSTENVIINGVNNDVNVIDDDVYGVECDVKSDKIGVGSVIINVPKKKEASIFDINNGIKLTSTEREVLESIKKCGKSSVKIISSQIGVSERTVFRALKKLKEYNIVQHLGSNKNGYWIIIK